MTHEGEQQQSDGVEGKHGRQGYGNLVILGLEHRRHGCNRTAATDRRTKGDQGGCRFLDPEQSAECYPQQQGDTDPDKGIEDRSPSGCPDLTKGQTKTEPDDRQLQQLLAVTGRLFGPGVAQQQADGDAKQQAIGSIHERKQTENGTKNKQDFLVMKLLHGNFSRLIAALSFLLRLGPVPCVSSRTTRPTMGLAHLTGRTAEPPTVFRLSLKQTENCWLKSLSDTATLR